jgi:predicted transcriptional regulator
MKTTIELPDDLVHRAKIAAAERRTTLRALVEAGLESVLSAEGLASERKAALERLQRGFKLGGRPLARHQVHERR